MVGLPYSHGAEGGQVLWGSSHLQMSNFPPKIKWKPKKIHHVPEPAPEQSAKGGQAFITRGGQSLKLSTNASVFKKVSLLIEEALAPTLSRSQMSKSPPKLKCRSQKKVITSADVQFSAQNQVKTKKRSPRPQAVVCTKTSQNFSWKNDLKCCYCS